MLGGEESVPTIVLDDGDVIDNHGTATVKHRFLELQKDRRTVFLCVIVVNTLPYSVPCGLTAFEQAEYSGIR